VKWVLPEDARRRFDARFPIALVAAIGLAYALALRGQFVWDDRVNIVANPRLHDLAGLAQIWTDRHASQQYYPLTYSSFWLNYQLGGLDPLGYHLVNVALHATTAVLLWHVLRSLAVRGAALAAGLFALHPLNVESVAWITERKNVLSGALALGACLAYLRYDAAAGDDTPRARRSWALAFGLFVLGLGAKTTTSVIPAALLVALVALRGRDLRRALVPLVPFFVAGVGGGLMTATLERSLVGAHGPEFAWSFPFRLVLAGRAYWFYLAKLVAPFDLMFFYPRWHIDPGSVVDWVLPLAVVAQFAVLVAWRARIGIRPLAAMLAYAVLIFPALGFFNVYFMRFTFAQDHFQYLAGMPALALVAAGADLGVEKAAAFAVARARPEAPGRKRRASPAKRAKALASRLRVPLAAALLGVLAAASAWKSLAFEDYETLFVTALEKNPDAWPASFNLAVFYREQHRYERAIPLYREALRVRPDDPDLVLNFAGALAESGSLGDALPMFEKAVRLRPDHATSRLDHATALEVAGRVDEAVAECREALRVDPSWPRAQRQLAHVLAAKADRDRAPH
jgi:tetratricopeptide (TPR) repeat protein